MYKKITIEEKEMELLANAATPFRYKQVFHKDLLQILGNESRAEVEGIDTVTELAYIMNQQALKADMAKLNFEGFLEWLEGFGSMAFVDAAEEILAAYMDNTTTASTP